MFLRLFTRTTTPEETDGYGDQWLTSSSWIATANLPII
jgi:hypothetical protein